MPNAPEYHKPFTAPAKRHEVQADNQAAYARQDKRYFATNSAPWAKLRAYVLMREPLCRHCKDKSPPMYTPASHVDHIDGDASSAFSNRIENLQPLCESCHNAKTAAELAATIQGRQVGG